MSTLELGLGECIIDGFFRLGTEGKERLVPRRGDRESAHPKPRRVRIWNSLRALSFTLLPLLSPLDLHLLLGPVLLLPLLGGDPGDDVLKRIVSDLDALYGGRVHWSICARLELDLVEFEHIEECISRRDSAEDGIAVVELVRSVQGKEESGDASESAREYVGSRREHTGRDSSSFGPGWP